MRTYDYAPLFRSTIGFDRLLNMLENPVAQPDWPPYNVEKLSADQYRIKMAIAGFTPQEVDVTQQGNTLTVVGQKTSEQGRPELLHQGLAFRNFKQSFSLAAHVKVASATMENGLLTIELAREVPEELKPRRIEIGGAKAIAAASQDNRPTLSAQTSDRVKAA